MAEWQVSCGVRVPTAKPLLLIWDELECIRSLVSITVRLAQPSPFVRKSKSRDQEKKPRLPIIARL